MFMSVHTKWVVAVGGNDRRRYRFEIWADVLESIREQRRLPGPLRPSRVRSKANLPHQRFWDHVEEMADTGLIDADELEPTPTGREFLEEMEDVQDRLARYGLS